MNSFLSSFEYISWINIQLSFHISSFSPHISDSDPFLLWRLQLSGILCCAVLQTLAYVSEAVSTSEISANFYKTTQCNAPEDSHLHTHCQFVTVSSAPTVITRFIWSDNKRPLANKPFDGRTYSSSHSLEQQWFQWSPY